MAQKDLTVETIGELDDGAAGLMVNAAIRAALRDLEDRGKDGQKRCVEIKLTFELRPNGQVETCVEAGPKIPRYRTAETVTDLRMDGKGEYKLIFQQHAPDDPRQRTLDEATEPKTHGDQE